MRYTIFGLVAAFAVIFCTGCPEVLSPPETPAAAGPNVLVVQIAGEAAARTALPSMPVSPTYDISVTRLGTELGGAKGVSGSGPFYIQLSENPAVNDVVKVEAYDGTVKYAEKNYTLPLDYTAGTSVAIVLELLTTGTGTVDLKISFVEAFDEITAAEVSIYRGFQNYQDKAPDSFTRYRKEGYGTGTNFPSSSGIISLTGDYSPGTYVAQIDFFRPNGVRVSRLVQTFVVRGNLPTNTWVETGNKTLTWNAFPSSSADLAEENGIVIEGIKEEYYYYKTTYNIYQPVSEIPDETTITVAPGKPGQTIAVSLNGAEPSLTGGGSISLSELKATNSIVIVVTAPDGVTKKTYTVGYTYYYNNGIWYVDADTTKGNDTEGIGSTGKPYATVKRALQIAGIAYANSSSPWPGKAENPLAAQIHINGTFTGADAKVDVDGDVHPPILLTGSGTIDVSGMTEDHRPSTIWFGGTLILGDGVTLTGGNHDVGGGGVYALQGSKFIMNGGTISGNTAPKGGGVFVIEGSSFTMNGGTISGGTGSRGVYVDTGCAFTMNGGTISGSAASSSGDGDFATAYGGGVYVNGSSFIMTGGTIRENTANSGGGGVYVNGSSFDMTGGTISGNTVSGGSGGGVYVTGDSSFTMTGGTIEENTVLYGDDGSGGGGVYVKGSVFTMTGGTISGNTLRYDNEGSGGGGVYVDANGDFAMNGGTISGNTANESGGGVYVANQDADGGGPYRFTMSGESSINGNSGKRGGGVCMESGIFAMAGGTISGNTASENGGGVCVGTPREGFSGSPDFTMTGGTISGNTASGGNGGGVCVSVNADNTLSKFAMNGGTISGNTASESGGGVYVEKMGEGLSDPPDFTMTGGTISGNTAEENGGGVYYNSSQTFNMDIGAAITIKENRAKGNGGGVYVAGGAFNLKTGATITISDNTAETNGGGVYAAGAFNMDAGTISGNDAKGTLPTSGGGGVYVAGGYSFTMTGGTISGNKASGIGSGMLVNRGSGGGVYVAGAFTMNGGTISGNDAAGSGGGVYFGSTGNGFNMESGAFIPQDNDVWLNTGKTINITGALTGTPPVARITLQTYSLGTQVLGGSDISSNCDKFTVTPQADGTEWEINDEGKLLQQP